MRFVKRKTMKIRESGRSSDFITPSFGFGCQYKCNYCYMRRHLKNGLTIANNTTDIIKAIDKHAKQQKWPKTPNQTHKNFYTYDFSCNEDYVKHAQYHVWRELFDYFKNSDRTMGTAATKYVNYDLLKYNAKRKVRIRFSLMPQHLSTILEPGTSSILERIEAIDEFYAAGYDVHVNYSPIIVYDNWLEDYKQLFRLIHKKVKNKRIVLSECIFLTHNESMHEHNVSKSTKGENLLWTPDIQVTKVSQYGGKNIRYNWFYKKKYIEQFKYMHAQIVPWNKIRYIF